MVLQCRAVSVMGALTWTSVLGICTLGPCESEECGSRRADGILVMCSGVLCKLLEEFRSSPGSRLDGTRIDVNRDTVDIRDSCPRM